MKNIPDGIFQERLRELMAEKGLTQQQLAAATGLTQSAISRYLGGRIPNTLELIRLVDFFKVSGDWLLWGAGARNPLPVQKAGDESAYPGKPIPRNPTQPTFDELVEFQRYVEDMCTNALSKIRERKAMYLQQIKTLEKEEEEMRERLKKVSTRGTKVKKLPKRKPAQNEAESK